MISITEKYLRRYPNSKKALEWNLRNVYIETRHGFWKPRSFGYTSELKYAGVFTFEEARDLVKDIYVDHGGRYILYEAQHDLQNLLVALKPILDYVSLSGANYIDDTFQITKGSNLAAKQITMGDFRNIEFEARKIAIYN